MDIGTYNQKLVTVKANGELVHDFVSDAFLYITSRDVASSGNIGSVESRFSYTVRINLSLFSDSNGLLASLLGNVFSLEIVDTNGIGFTLTSDQARISDFGLIYEDVRGSYMWVIEVPSAEITIGKTSI